MITQSGSSAPSAVPAACLFAATAVSSLLAGALPLSTYGDANLFDASSIHIAAIVVPAALLIVAALTCVGSRPMLGLGGGAALAAASFMGAMALALWSATKGKYLGAGSTMMFVTAALAVVTVFAALPSFSSRPHTGAHVLGFVATLVLSVGATLVPEKASGISWSDWNFPPGASPAFVVAGQVFTWIPVIAGFCALAKGGRAGALFGLAGSSVMAWTVVATAATDPSSDGFSALRMVIHPVATVGAVATVVMFVIAIGASAETAPAESESAAWPDRTGTAPESSPVGSSPQQAPTSANPARWAADPFGRFESRYWDGSAWTANVATGGATSIDPPKPAAVVEPVVGGQPARPQAPSAMSAFAERPAPVQAPVGSPAPFATGLAVAGKGFGAPSDQTVPRAGVAPAAVPVLEVLFDNGQRATLVTPLVIGRAPSPRAHLPEATLLPLADSTMSVSATHLVIGPGANGAWVEDTGSTNGSELIDSAGGAARLQPGVRVDVAVGARVRFGERSAQILAVGGELAAR